MNIINVRNTVPYIREVEVRGDSWRKTRGSLLITGGVLTCIAAAVYIPEKKIGYLGHFSALGDTTYPSSRYSQAEFEAMLSDVDATAGSNDLEIWLGGGVIGPCPEVFQDRGHAEKSLRAVGGNRISKFATGWSEAILSTAVLLDSADGTLFVEQEPSPDAFDD